MLFLLEFSKKLYILDFMGRNKKELEDKKKKITLTIDTTIHDLVKKHLVNKGEWNESAYIESLLDNDLYQNNDNQNIERIQLIIHNEIGRLYSIKDCTDIYEQRSCDLKNMSDKEVWLLAYQHII